tara:strand:+ start:1131 stop:2228 length:1098 start_codon:yes stop_codon:yes gene_type:complete
MKNFTLFSKYRNSFLEGKEHLSVVIYFVLLFCIDVTGIMDLYGQNVIRRIVNMYRRIDKFTYEKKLKPFCIKYDKVLNDMEVAQLQSIKVPEKNDTAWFTRKYTTTHQCCDNYTEEESKIIKEISEKIKKRYEKKIGKQLYYLGSNKATIYRYHGNYSQHLWHVDPQNLSEIYNIIICIKRIGNISPLQCKNDDGEAYSIHFKEGDAALFNGGTTIHQVPPNNDANSERTVLSIAFTSNEEIGNSTNMSNNMCTHIEGGNNYLNIIKIVLLIFFLNLLLSHISGINVLSYITIFLLFTFFVLIVKYIPYYFDIGLGSGRSSSIYHNFILLVVFIILTFSIKGGTIFLSYFILSDVFFPRYWVEYD